MFGFSITSILIGILIGASLTEGTRLAINGWRRWATQKITDTFKE